MRLLILGASGRTGAHVLERARWAGHRITVLVRDPVGFGAPEQVRVLGGDVTDKHALARAVDDQQAVISLAGSLRQPVAAPIARAVVGAATHAGAERLMVLAPYGPGLDRRELPLGLRWSRVRGSAKLRADRVEAEEAVRGAALDWTLTQAVRLTDDPPVGDFRAAETVAAQGPWRISRADVARFLVDQLQGHAWSRRAVVLTTHH
ncbi:uncharacterized protein YbjT (DUF2867 family) [Friedmanniella endophytica]|uniref:Uncharacterized protein YbjT (DUF2867 family) n=1 Tax=Microlunatus kandeliicorticis TaxID=1759536 RepID=A0A7W3P5X1_9ACTN|nr:NAD(P)-binding oxidoreductase [Microlunatus kandeliicorticis]MBA8794384.1 uncharacterized protein YbjT (DUF2867 family) [Microlunatus kandeliicorticis]